MRDTLPRTRSVVAAAGGRSTARGFRTRLTLFFLLALCAPAFAKGDLVAAGTKAPALVLEQVLPGFDGTSSCEFAGKVTLVEFWFTTCGPCRQAIPHVNKLVRTYGSRGFQAVSVTFDAEPVVRKFLAEVPIDAMVGIDTSRRTIGAYGVSAYPTSILVGRDGTILAATHPDAITGAVIENALAGRDLALAPSALSETTASPDLPAPVDPPDALASCSLRESRALGSSSFQIQKDVIKLSGVDKRSIIRTLAMASPDLCDFTLKPDDRIYDFEAHLDAAPEGRLIELARAFVNGAWNLDVKHEERLVEAAVVSLPGPLKGVRPWDGTNRGASRNAFVGMPLSLIVDDIAFALGVHGIDETHDSTFYDFELAFDEASPIEEQAFQTFGLKVTREKRPVTFLVVREGG